MYHRIANPPYDPWGLCVAPERFRDQLAVLRTHRVLMPMDDLVEALASGTAPPRATALTFDDGYSDNAAAAKPLLEEMQVPATMFLTTGLLGSERPFWWDELAMLALAGRRAANIDFEVAGVHLAARWERQDSLPPDLRHWRTFDKTGDLRRSAYARLWSALQRLEASARDRAMAALRERLPRDDSLVEAGGDWPLSVVAARDLPSRTISLGGHGRAHVPLPALPLEARRVEIAGGRADLLAIDPNGQAAGFTYPHGEWDAATRDIVIEAGYRWAAAAHEGKVDTSDYDRFALPRIKVDDWSGAQLLRRMRFVGAV
jgi:peptidoglycan/xylan/chitin deacetylase (PgdA/CDA1 family)